MFFVYVLHSLKDGNFYVGYSANVEKRFREHLAGRAPSTKHRLPLKLIYWEAYVNKADAKGRELFLKSGSGLKFIRKQLKNYLAEVRKK